MKRITTESDLNDELIGRKVKCSINGMHNIEGRIQKGITSDIDGNDTEGYFICQNKFNGSMGMLKDEDLMGYEYAWFINFISIGNIELEEESESDPEPEKIEEEMEEIKTKDIFGNEVEVKSKLKMKPKTNNVADAMGAFMTMLQGMELIDYDKVGDFVDDKVQSNLKGLEEEIKKIKKQRPTQVIVNGIETAKIESRVHKSFKDALNFCNIERQLFIAGPAGTGKTTLAHNIGTALGLEFAHISCSAGLSEGHLLGKMNFKGEYLQSDLVRLYESGGVFLFDEIDAADANTMLVINSALANGSLSVPNRVDKPVAKRHEKFICICAANTWGSGSMEYHGRNYLDAAFLDRFTVSKLFVDYDTELEHEIMESSAPLWAAELWKIRLNINTNKIRRILSTRVFASAAKNAVAGNKFEHVVNTYMLGWSEEEKSKALNGVNIKSVTGIEKKK